MCPSHTATTHSNIHASGWLSFISNGDLYSSVLHVRSLSKLRVFAEPMARAHLQLDDFVRRPFDCRLLCCSFLPLFIIAASTQTSAETEDAEGEDGLILKELVRLAGMEIGGNTQAHLPLLASIVPKILTELIGLYSAFSNFSMRTPEKPFRHLVLGADGT
ncbi:hypothetical protein BDQ17DRAFT_1410109 [Cyathus striatus]|nr:hypothetical protein BDQ17DRAFT_1410109 [Cyathus striatus]